jgi:ABC-type Na+ efflux pump permease subunit
MMVASISFITPVYAVNFSDLIQINLDTTTNVDTSASSTEVQTTESSDTATVESETTQDSSEGGDVSQNTVMIAAIIIVFMFLIMLV